MMPAKLHPLWDLPTRLCHWLIVACVGLSWWSAETENHELHQWLGYTVIVLVVSRIAWGFVGSPHSRFTDFLVGPGRVLAYIRGGGSGSAGHNPLGGWSVIALLLLLLLQAISGLFNSDDVFFNGPLYYGASVALRDAMGVVHDVAFYALLSLVGLHILAVLYHQFRRRERLMQAMVRGSAIGRSGRSAPVSSARALLVVLVVALALWGLLQLAPPPPPVMW
jgi:cytochrome b